MKLISKNDEKKRQIKRVGLNREVERWAFGDADDYGDISMLDIHDNDKPGEINFLKKKNEEEKKENEEPKKPPTVLAKRGNNSMSRLVPGALQKNITAERNFFKELLQLSQQRYVNLHSLEFEKKNFIEKQANKGIYQNDGIR